jgi:hypothetical protein
MLVAILCLGSIVLSAPMVATLIVATASRREDRNWSLGSAANGPLESIARRIVAFDADSIDWPQSKARALAETSNPTLMPEAVDSTASEARTQGAA